MNSFSESQRFTQWWLWAILIGILILPARMLFSIWSGDNKSVHWGILVINIAIPLLVFVLFLMLNLKTSIDETGISYQFVPFHLKPMKNSWTEIDSAYIRKYSPLAEFGGWGIRYSFGNGKAYNVSGDMGLQIVFKNGKKLLIGTQKPDEIRAVLKTLARSGKINITSDL